MFKLLKEFLLVRFLDYRGSLFETYVFSRVLNVIDPLRLGELFVGKDRTKLRLSLNAGENGFLRIKMITMGSEILALICFWRHEVCDEVLRSALLRCRRQHVDNRGKTLALKLFHMAQRMQVLKLMKES